MNIVSLLSERRVIPDMSAGTRDEVLEEMVGHLPLFLFAQHLPPGSLLAF